MLIAGYWTAAREQSGGRGGMGGEKGWGWGGGGRGEGVVAGKNF